MNQYLCLASEPWQGIPTRTQQLLTRLRGAQVLYFEPPAPWGSGAHRRPGRRVRPGLVVYTLPPLLEVDERHAYLFRRGQNRLLRFVERTMERHRFQEPVLWCTCPSQVHLADGLPHRALVYDCDREWSGFPLRWESDLALAADLIFAASPGLADRLSPCSDNIALLPNGANFAMFSRPELEDPAELRGVKAPVLGYAGTIWRDLDLEPLRRAAQAHPDCAFVLVGRAENNPQLGALKALNNVALLGERAPAELPDYLGRFDVCLNLLRRAREDSDVLSPRIYEYLSTGKPIVSMVAGDQIEPFPDVIYTAHTPQEFSRLCGQALSEAGDWARSRRRRYGADSAWSRRAEDAARILESIGLY